MSPSSPIHVPELVEFICKHLNRTAMARCTLVSKSWYTAFTPHLYRDVKMFYTHQNRIEKQKPILDLKKYGIHARSLTFDTLWLPHPTPPEEELFGSTCNHLTTLYLNLGILNMNNIGSLHCARLLDLIRHNPSIMTLHLHHGYSAEMDQLITDSKILKRLPGLQNLVLMNSYISNDSSFDELLDCGPQLVKLDYDIRWDRRKRTAATTATAIATTTTVVDSMNDHRPRPMWTKISSLTIKDYPGSRAIELVAQCPNLQHLTAILLNDEDRHSVLNQMVQHRRLLGGNHPTCLSSLDLFGVRGHDSMKALADLLRVCADSTRLRAFLLDCSGMSEEIMKELLTYHAESLEKVIISLCDYGPDSSQSSSFLSKCPRLRNLKIWSRSQRINLEDLVESPWVCHDLQFLDIRLSRSASAVTLTMPLYAPEQQQQQQQTALPAIPEEEHDDEDETELQRRLWEQIANLTKIERLNIILKKTVRTEGATLWATQDGLEKLLGLKRLTEITISKLKNPPSNIDRRQLLNKLPKLRINYSY
ncbi:hypothetical protein BGZ65_008765 [Modicella reniformis]|uniref:F-box domain-containing protein n=1 Tax=Modicella reniformis TaxID=1440133 RepID=A0A9P6LU27_9FUNG|nr:hypothetical protein BGZ65_008765 [Modicella reniformis]